MVIPPKTQTSVVDRKPATACCQVAAEVIVPYSYIPKQGDTMFKFKLARTIIILGALGTAGIASANCSKTKDDTRPMS